jgi:hypothetical protein
MRGHCQATRLDCGPAASRPSWRANVGTVPVTFKLDKTAPSITGAVTSGTKTASGWYVGPVTVTFTYSDILSGVATSPDPVVLSANGANTSTGTTTGKAGNTASAIVSGINIDQERPTITTADVKVQGSLFTLGTAPAPTCTATDSFAGWPPAPSQSAATTPMASGRSPAPPLRRTRSATRAR